MGEGDYKGEEYKGRAKEAVGDLTDDDQAKREGKADQASASAKRTMNKAKEKAEEAKDKTKDALSGDDSGGSGNA